MKFNIDTAAARATHATELNDKANSFFMELEDRLSAMTAAEQSALLNHLTAVVASKDATMAFTAGQYAQQNNGQPAAALGAGTAAPSAADETAALGVLMGSPLIDNGVKQALRRLLNPSDPNPLMVEADGTPSELVATRNERDTAKTERDAARQALQDEKDPSKPGSLARQLSDAQVAAVAFDDMVSKGALLPLVQAIEVAADNLDTGMMTSHISGLPELVQAIASGKAAVS